MIVVSDTTAITTLIKAGREGLLADFLLIDERRGRRIAQERHLKIIGLLGIVLLAHGRGLIAAVRPLLLELQSKGRAYLAPELVEATCRSVGE